MSQVKKTGPQFDQGEWGAGSTKANGSPREVAADVKRQGKTGDPFGQRDPSSRSSAGGAATGQDVSFAHGAPRTSVRGGGGIGGHSRDPGSKSSGSDKAQNPNVNNKNDGPSGTYLGK